MEKSTKRFIYAALFYLAVGAVVGLLQAINPFWVNALRFSHAHILLLGFMAMMVFGIGYFILPRFSSTSLLWPGLVNVHFWLANTGLVGMVLFKPLGVALMSPLLTGLFYAAAVAQVLGVFMFCINMAATLATAPELPNRKPSTTDVTGSSIGTAPPAAAAKPAARGPALTPDSPVAYWVDGKEGARELLVAAGLRPVADPQHMEMVRKIGVTLSHACMKHGIDLDEVVTRLSALPDKPWNRSPAGAQGLSMAPGGVGGCGSPQPVEAACDEITPDTIIGAMVDAYPETAPVLEKRFGSGCFTCPGFATETLTQGAMMHGADVEQLVSELKGVLGK